MKYDKNASLRYDATIEKRELYIVEEERILVQEEESSDDSFFMEKD